MPLTSVGRLIMLLPSSGEAGSNAMKALFLDRVLPSAEERRTLEQSKQAAAEIMRSGRFAWFAEAARTELCAAAALIDGLIAGHPALCRGEPGADGMDAESARSDQLLHLLGASCGRQKCSSSSRL